MIENAAKGENWMFRNLYMENNGVTKDILSDGRWSCAVFVSAILYLFKLIGDVHANVDSVEKDILDSGWRCANSLNEKAHANKSHKQARTSEYDKKLKPGVVIVWEKILAPDDNTEHGHIGFYIGDGTAVSNNSRLTGFPWRHHYTYNNTRKIEKIYWYPELED